MTNKEAIRQLSLLMMQCGMLMPIEWVLANGADSPLMEAVGMAVEALHKQEENEE